MSISDVVAANLTTLYLVVIAAMKAYGLVTGKNFTGAFVLIASTAVVAVILIVSLAWDVSRKAADALSPRDRILNTGSGGHEHEMCRGGICWHGVAVKSPMSQVRFRLPQNNRQ